MKWFDLVKEYEEKNGSFAHASYNDEDYILFRFEMIKTEFGVDGAEALKMMIEQIENATGSILNRGVVKEYERKFLDVLRANGKDW